MRVDWYGQSAFALRSHEHSVFIDPFGDLSPLAGRGIRFDYPPIAGVGAELVLVTHEHVDHNGVQAIGGDPVILRATAGRLPSPIGEVLAHAQSNPGKISEQLGVRMLLRPGRAHPRNPARVFRACFARALVLQCQCTQQSALL